jgi:protein-tyrosine-phosphatase
MSAFAVERLKKLEIPLAMAPGGRLPAHAPTALTMQDLERCDRVIAMHGPTHRPMLRRFVESRMDQARNPKALLDRVVYWNIADVIPSPAVPISPAEQADRALDAIQKEVEALFAGL